MQRVTKAIILLCILAVGVAGAALRLTERLDFRILDFQFKIFRACDPVFWAPFVLVGEWRQAFSEGRR